MNSRSLLACSVLLTCSLAVSCAAGSNRPMAQDPPQRIWPPDDIVVTPPEPPQTATKITYTIRFENSTDEEHVTILTTATDYKINEKPDGKGPRQIVIPGTAPDVTISNGWLYLIGKHTAVGAHSVAAGATGSKLILDADYKVNGSARTQVQNVESAGTVHLWRYEGADQIPTTVPVHYVAEWDGTRWVKKETKDDPNATAKRDSVRDEAGKHGEPVPEYPPPTPED